MLMTFLGGAWMPLSLMGSAVQTAAHFVPTYWVNDAIGKALASDLTSAVLGDIACDLGVTVLFAAAIASVPAGTLVVVDQFRNIGSLAVRRARAAGLGVAHLPGLAASRAAGLFAGEAKTDERDAAVIARTALGVPDSLSGVPGRGEALEAARALSSQRDHVVACATRDKNRLRAVLLESCPALEAAVDLSDRRWLELLAGFGGAWGIARSGAEGPQAEAAGEAAAVSATVKTTNFAIAL